MTISVGKVVGEVSINDIDGNIVIDGNVNGNIKVNTVTNKPNTGNVDGDIIVKGNVK